MALCIQTRKRRPEPALNLATTPFITPDGIALLKLNASTLAMAPFLQEPVRNMEIANASTSSTRVKWWVAMQRLIYEEDQANLCGMQAYDPSLESTTIHLTNSTASEPHPHSPSYDVYEGEEDAATVQDD